MKKDKIITKNLKLSADFNAYVASNPDIIADLPDKVCIVFEIKSDKNFSAKNLENAKKAKRKGAKCYVATKEKKHWGLKPLKVTT